MPKVIVTARTRKKSEAFTSLESPRGTSRFVGAETSLLTAVSICVKFTSHYLGSCSYECVEDEEPEKNQSDKKLVFVLSRSRHR